MAWSALLRVRGFQCGFQPVSHCAARLSARAWLERRAFSQGLLCGCSSSEGKVLSFFVPSIPRGEGQRFYPQPPIHAATPIVVVVVVVTFIGIIVVVVVVYKFMTEYDDRI